MAERIMNPCPFCDSRRLTVRDGTAYCDSCGATGARGRNLSTAIALWNRRTTTTPVTREELAEALRHLVNETSGSIRLAEPEIRRAIGTTNLHCILRRVDEACSLLSRLDAEQNTVTRLPHWWPVQPPEYEGEEGRTIDNVIECWDHTGDAEESYRPLAEWAVKIGFRPILDAEQNGGGE